MKKRIIALLLVSLMIVSVMPSTSYAASGTKKTTLYYCYKSGDTVYCSGLHHLYKVNLKTRQVKVLNSPQCYAGSFKLKGKYLYCAGNGQSAETGVIYRVNTKTGSYKMLARRTFLRPATNGFAISGSKIYYSTISWRKDGSEKLTKRVMSLSGKSKKKSKQKIKVKKKDTNNSSYKVWSKELEFPYYEYYLKTPNGNIYLGPDAL